ncbi:MAG TPA: chemotaxis protein CheW [Planctomycetota bacterium]|jgi:purine-binding chemotaxis protein CheW
MAENSTTTNSAGATASGSGTAALPSSAAQAAKPGKYLSFKLAAEEHGLEILKVQEIIGLMKITRVPTVPPFVRGVINLRGKVIPVIDLRVKFGMEAAKDDARTCVIVVQIVQGERRVTTGIIVDEVSEVLNITADQIEPAPQFGTSVSTDFILGMGKVAEKVVMLLDIDKILRPEQTKALAELVPQTDA